MIRFIQNMIVLTGIVGLVAYGAAVYYFRTHGIDNDLTTSAWVFGLGMIPVSFFVQRP